MTSKKIKRKERAEIRKLIKELEKRKTKDAKYPSEEDLNNFQISAIQEQLRWKLNE